MGAGLPVVCFDTRVNRQLLGDDGYYVSTDDGIIDGIQAVIRDPANAKVRGIAGQKRVELNYSWDASADRVKTVYQVPMLGFVPCFCDVLRAEGNYIFAQDKPDHPFTKILAEMTKKIEANEVK